MFLVLGYYLLSLFLRLIAMRHRRGGHSVHASLNQEVIWCIRTYIHICTGDVGHIKQEYTVCASTSGHDEARSHSSDPAPVCLHNGPYFKSGES